MKEHITYRHDDSRVHFTDLACNTIRYTIEIFKASPLLAKKRLYIGSPVERQVMVLRVVCFTFTYMGMFPHQI